MTSPHSMFRRVKHLLNDFVKNTVLKQTLYEKCRCRPCYIGLRRKEYMSQNPKLNIQRVLFKSPTCQETKKFLVPAQDSKRAKFFKYAKNSFLQCQKCKGNILLKLVLFILKTLNAENCKGRLFGRFQNPVCCKFSKTLRGTLRRH